MDGVNGLSNQNKYDESDIERMKGLESLSTNAAINRIGNHAGLDTTHTIHGSDATESEVIAAHQEVEQDRWLKEMISLIPDGGDPTVAAVEITEAFKEGGLHEAIKSGSRPAIEAAILGTIEHASEHAVKHGGPFAVRALGGAAFVWKLGKFAYTMAQSVAHDGDTGLARSEARVKSALHTVVLGSLNGLPQGYVNDQRARYVADAPKPLVDRMAAAMGRGDNPIMGVIQLHCDQGIAAARSMYGAGQTDFFAYLEAHPDVARRVAEDPAFKAGFEGALYAHDHGQYDAMMKALDERDVRYTQHNIAFRG